MKFLAILFLIPTMALAAVIQHREVPLGITFWTLKNFAGDKLEMMNLVAGQCCKFASILRW